MYKITRQHDYHWYTAACTTQAYYGTCLQGSKRGMLSAACQREVMYWELYFWSSPSSVFHNRVMNYLEITQQHKSRSILQRCTTQPYSQTPVYKEVSRVCQAWRQHAAVYWDL